MPATAAKCDETQQKSISLPPPAPELSVQKRRMIQLLGEGRSVSQISEILHCDRSRVYRWLKEPSVIAERNRQATEMWDAAQARLQGLVHKSINVVERHLDEDHSLKAACAILKFTGVANMSKPETEVDQRAIIRKQAEEYAIRSYLDRPFAEKTIGKQMHQNETFQALVQSLWEALQQRYQPGDNDADEVLYEALNRPQ